MLQSAEAVRSTKVPLGTYSINNKIRAASHTTPFLSNHPHNSQALTSLLTMLHLRTKACCLHALLSTACHDTPKPLLVRHMLPHLAYTLFDAFLMNMHPYTGHASTTRSLATENARSQGSCAEDLLPLGHWQAFRGVSLLILSKTNPPSRS